jgi:hypothetical protein
MRELFEGLDYLNRQRPIARHDTSACPPITGDKCEGAELKPRAPCRRGIHVQRCAW